MNTLSRLLSSSMAALLCFLLIAAITQLLSQQRYAKASRYLIAYGKLPYVYAKTDTRRKTHPLLTLAGIKSANHFH